MEFLRRDYCQEPGVTKDWDLSAQCMRILVSSQEGQLSLLAAVGEDVESGKKERVLLSVERIFNAKVVNYPSINRFVPVISHASNSINFEKIF